MEEVALPQSQTNQKENKLKQTSTRKQKIINERMLQASADATKEMDNLRKFQYSK